MAQYSLPEPPINPPEPSREEQNRIDEHWRIIDEIRAVEGQIENIREAQDAWTEFNRTLHALTPPAQIIAAWDAIKPWIDSLAGVTTAQLEVLQDAENDLLF